MKKLKKYLLINEKRISELENYFHDFDKQAKEFFKKVSKEINKTTEKEAEKILGYYNELIKLAESNQRDLGFQEYILYSYFKGMKDDDLDMFILYHLKKQSKKNNDILEKLKNYKLINEVKKIDKICKSVEGINKKIKNYGIKINL